MILEKINSVKRSVVAFRRSKWFALFLVCVFLGGFIILTSEVHEALDGEKELIGTIDRETLAFFTQIRARALNGVAIDLTALGSGVVLTILTTFVCLFLFSLKRPLQIIQLLFASLGGAGITSLLKSYFERSRPDLSLRLVEVQGFSYPSGHSLSAAAIYFTIAIILCKPIQIIWVRRILWTLFLVLIALIGISRIYLGVHFFSDILSGILIGIAWASFVEFMTSHFKTRI